MWGKNDGSYDSLTSWDEYPDFTKIKEAKEAQIKKEKRGHKKREKAQIKNKKREKKREGAMLLSFYHTCASK